MPTQGHGFSEEQRPHRHSIHGIFLDVAPLNLTGAEDASSLPSIAATLRKRGESWWSISLQPSPSDTEIDEVMAKIAVEHWRNNAQPRGCLAISLSAPLALEGQKKLLIRCAKLAAENCLPFVVFLMRSPYDCRGVLELCRTHGGAEPTVMATYEYTELSAASVVDYLLGDAEATGICPVTISP
jgi:hypothetical protein